MKTRIISAIIAIIIIIPLLIIGGTWFYVLVGILGIIGYNEMLSVRNSQRKIPVIMKFISMISFLLILLPSMNNQTYFLIDYKIVALILLLNTIPLVFYSRSKYNVNDAFFLIGSSLFLGVAFNFIVTLRNIDLKYILYIAIITIMSDTFAHLWGTYIGKHKLCPGISPNKTVEGLIGGTLLGTALGTIFFTAAFDYTSFSTIVLITLALSLIGQCGDLVFSAIKRTYEVKDFGNIMPGHGGILDRFDSIFFAIIAFSIIMYIL